jgi:hypothetical protein
MSGAGLLRNGSTGIQAYTLPIENVLNLGFHIINNGGGVPDSIGLSQCLRFWEFHRKGPNTIGYEKYLFYK